MFGVIFLDLGVLFTRFYGLISSVVNYLLAVFRLDQSLSRVGSWTFSAFVPKTWGEIEDYSTSAPVFLFQPADTVFIVGRST